MSTLSGFKGSFYCAHQRNPTEQEIFDEGIREGGRRTVSGQKPVKQALEDESNGAWAAFEKSVHASMSNRDDLWPVWADAWDATPVPATVSGQKPAAYKVTTKEQRNVWFTEAKNQADHTRSEGHQVEELYAAPIPSTVSGQEAIGWYHRYKLSETLWCDWMPCSEKNARLYSDLPKFEVAMFYRNAAPIPATELSDERIMKIAVRLDVDEYLCEALAVEFARAILAAE